MTEKRASSSILEMIAGGRRPNAQRHEALLDKPADGPAKVIPDAETDAALVERALSSKGNVDPAAARNDLAALHGVLQGLSRKTVVIIFAMGKVLSEVKTCLPHGDFLSWIEGNCPFDPRSAQRYMLVFERYKNEPRRALEELTIAEAYIEAGVKKLSAPEGSDDPARRRGELDADLPVLDDFKQLFKTPPISGAPLKRHRIVPYRDGELYVVNPELGPIPVCNLYVDMSISDAAYQDAVQQVHHNLAIALEVFFSKVEELEDRGVLSMPFNSSRSAMVGKMRNVSPDMAAVAAGKKTPQKKGEAPARKKGGSK